VVDLDEFAHSHRCQKFPHSVDWRGPSPDTTERVAHSGRIRRNLPVR
jgi:hypothetical protein